MYKKTLLIRTAFVFVLFVLHSITSAEEPKIPAANSASKIRVGLAIIEPRFAGDTASLDVLVIGPLPINIKRPPRAEFKTINIAAEVERATCASLVEQFQQITCTPFPVKITLADVGIHDDPRDAYKATYSALGKHNAALPADQRFDAILVITAGQINERQHDKWGMFGIVFQEAFNVFFQSQGYISASFIAMEWRFFEATQMEQLSWFRAQSLPLYDKENVIPKDELPAYLAKLPSDTQVEGIIRRKIDVASGGIGKMLDMGLWNRFKEEDPWAYIRARRQ